MTGGEPANKELEDAKKASKEEIDKLLASVEDSSDEIKAKKEEVKEILKSSMENAYKLKVPLIVDMCEADNWYDAK